MDFWNDKDERYKFKIVDVYNEQVRELIKIVADFKRRKKAMNNELPKTKVDERTGIEYNLEGDYYIPNLAMPKQEKLF